MSDLGICYEVHPDGYICTRPEGHDGAHLAADTCERPVCQWLGDETRRFEVGPQPLEELTASVGYLSSPGLNFTALALVAAELARLLARYLAGENDMGDEGDAATWLDEFDRLRSAIVREAVAS